MTSVLLLLFSLILLNTFNISYVNTLLPRPTEPNTTTNNEKIISLDCQLFLNSLSVFIKVGSDKQILIFTIDTESPHSRISDYLFSFGSSSLQYHNNISLTIPTGQITAQLIEDTIIIEDSLWLETIAEVPGFHFGLVPNQETIIDDTSVLAFSFNIDNDYYSLVHLFKQANIINKKQFGIYRNINSIFSKSTSKGGYIYIGGFPSNITNALYENAIDVHSKYNHWSIPLQYVFIGEISYVYTNKYYEVNGNAVAYVSTAHEDIVVPKLFYQEYVVSYYFKDAFEKNICVLKNHTDYAVSCLCEYVSSFESVSFVIGRKNYVIEPKFLFKQYDASCTFIITQHVDESEEKWILGVFFVWQYQTLFDYEGKRVVLYSDKEVYYVDLDAIFPGKKIFKTMLIIGSIITVISLSCVVIRFFKRRKMRKMNNVMKNFYKKITETN